MSVARGNHKKKKNIRKTISVHTVIYTLSYIYIYIVIKIIIGIFKGERGNPATARAKTGVEIKPEEPPRPARHRLP